MDWERRKECMEGENEVEERVKRMKDIIVKTGKNVCGTKKRDHSRGGKWLNEALNEKEREIRMKKREYKTAK